MPIDAQGLTAIVHAMFAGTAEEIDALFAEADPSVSERDFMRGFVNRIAAPGELMVYDFDALVAEMESIIERQGRDVFLGLAKKARARTPEEMVYEFIGAARQVYVFDDPSGWVWGPSGPPFRGDAGTEERYAAHAARYGADLGAVTDVLLREGNARANELFDGLRAECDLVFGLVEEAVSARAEHQRISEAVPADPVAVAVTGWASCLADRRAAEANLGLAARVAPVSAWIVCDTLEQVGWATISSTVRLRVLRERWMAYPSDGTPGRFEWWADNLPAGIVGWWEAVRLASGVEACRVVLGEQHAAGVVLGRDSRFTGG